MKHKSDLIAGFAALVFAALIFLLTRTMPESPAGFPRLIAIGFAICGVLMVLRNLRGGRQLEAAPSKGAQRANNGLALITALMWFALLWTAGKLGFVLPGFVFLVTLSWLLLGRPKEKSELVRIFAFGVLISVILWVVFGQVLGVEAPGIFGI